MSMPGGSSPQKAPSQQEIVRLSFPRRRQNNGNKRISGLPCCGQEDYEEHMGSEHGLDYFCRYWKAVNILEAVALKKHLKELLICVVDSFTAGCIFF